MALWPYWEQAANVSKGPGLYKNVSDEVVQKFGFSDEGPEIAAKSESGRHTGRCATQIGTRRSRRGHHGDQDAADGPGCRTVGCRGANADTDGGKGSRLSE